MVELGRLGASYQWGTQLAHRIISCRTDGEVSRPQPRGFTENQDLHGLEIGLVERSCHRRDVNAPIGTTNGDAHAPLLRRESTTTSAPASLTESG